MKLLPWKKDRDAPDEAREDAEEPSAEEKAETTPLPEPREPRLEDPKPTELSKRDYFAVVVRAGKEAIADNIPDSAAAMAYYSFLAIPAVLLISVGIFSLVASPRAIETVIEKLGTVVPGEAITLLEDSLTRAIENPQSGWYMVIVGGAVALWTATGAINALMRALNVAYDREETRGFFRQRLTALAMLVLMLIAVGLVVVLLILGPILSDWIGGVVGLETVFKWIWWTVQWPVLILGLLFVFAGLLYLGPNVDHPRWSFVTLGSAVAVVLWLVGSGAFALYVAAFASYNKTWGSLAAVIIMLTWLWLSSLAILFGAEINAEAERSRELRRGEPAEREIQAPAKA